MNYKKTIGIEVHCELKTNNKIFSPSPAQYINIANTNVNIIDMGYPGTLPIFNLEVLKLAIRACTVLNLKITKKMHFDRKNYFYPDNPKNFQITQQRTPIGRDGYVEIEINGVKKRIEIEEMHIEEDTCKSIHGENNSLLDFNRAGVPLLEIVSKPCIDNEDEAVLYLEKLRELLLYSDISDCKIEEGSMRCDTNVSVSKTDSLGTKVEIKNIGSISNVRKAIQYETNRQINILNNNGKITEETRKYDEKNNCTISLRVKETGNDYRYFPEPDIPYIILDDEIIRSSSSGLMRNPEERYKSYLSKGISDINAQKIIQNKTISDYLESFQDVNLVIASNLLLGDIANYLNKHSISINDTNLTKDKFRDIVNKLDQKEISNHQFKDLLNFLMETNKSIDELIKEKGLVLVNDQIIINEMITKVLDENNDLVMQYKNGNTRASKALMGLLMKEAKGQIEPSVANETLMKNLNQK